MSLIDYRGNCHCAAFKFTFKAPELKQGHACTCSFCSKNGYLWGFPAADFTVVKGDEETTLKTYQFGKRTMVHKFCPTCGTTVLARLPSADGSPQIGINIRALRDVDIEALEVIISTKGASTEPLYQAPEPVATGTIPEGSTVYQGSCHCGAVRYALVNPEKITAAKSCNCSICSRDATVRIFPETTSVIFAGVDESVAEYTFGSKKSYNGFCKICGVPIYGRFVGLSPEYDTKTALNIRTINGLDLALVEITMSDGKSYPGVYDP
ncbi:glutathione-dependent formaldehyde-activating enzyme [Mycena metata]|uniref:Glutathione-dependent formaldehyde-activating enzyme n=1 Tax=Mycena metata TaxID=1033252 RepID=A0AAD7J5Y3_9AGAR|nr:glutathione-dependent formaldehyde-activating enzyme [Mycena metata]KAJ7784130.1 glutathione-dependent formaldehyde-activating enzyme [Mycena metata]